MNHSLARRVESVKEDARNRSQPKNCSRADLLVALPLARGSCRRHLEVCRQLRPRHLVAAQQHPWCGCLKSRGNFSASRVLCTYTASHVFCTCTAHGPRGLPQSRALVCRLEGRVHRERSAAQTGSNGALGALAPLLLTCLRCRAGGGDCICIHLPACCTWCWPLLPAKPGSLQWKGRMMRAQRGRVRTMVRQRATRTRTDCPSQPCCSKAVNAGHQLCIEGH